MTPTGGPGAGDHDRGERSPRPDRAWAGSDADDAPAFFSGLTAEQASDPVVVVGAELHRKSTTRRVVEALLSLAVTAAIFAFVIPAVTDSHYSDIWHELTRLSAGWLLALAVIWMLGMLAYTGVLTNSLPGLTHPQALVVNFAGSAVSNVVPFGGAAGVGATYAIEMSWGFTMPRVTLSILVSGVWNVFAKLGMPVVALALLIGTGRATNHLLWPTVVGLVALVGAAVVLVMVMRSDALAGRVAAVGQRVVSAPCRWLHRPVPDVPHSVLGFRHSSLDLLRARWLRLTVWVVAYNLGQYLLLLACVRAVGVGTESLGWIEVFAAFAFARLLETIPLTPSGVGFVEAGAVAALIGFGGNDAACAAAVFLFRGFTYLAEIPIGAGAWVVWATHRGWRRQVSTPAAAAAS